MRCPIHRGSGIAKVHQVRIGNKIVECCINCIRKYGFQIVDEGGYKKGGIAAFPRSDIIATGDDYRRKKANSGGVQLKL